MAATTTTTTTTIATQQQKAQNKSKAKVDKKNIKIAGYSSQPTKRAYYRRLPLRERERRGGSGGIQHAQMSEEEEGCV